MGYAAGFRGHGVHLGVESAALVREEFWRAVRSGLSPTAAATVAGVAGATGRKWAKAAGYQTDRKHYGTRYSQQVRNLKRHTDTDRPRPRWTAPPTVP
jgi:transposase, IS30 family